MYHRTTEATEATEPPNHRTTEPMLGLPTVWKREDFKIDDDDVDDPSESSAGEDSDEDVTVQSLAPIARRKPSKAANHTNHSLNRTIEWAMDGWSASNSRRSRRKTAFFVVQTVSGTRATGGGIKKRPRPCVRPAASYRQSPKPSPKPSPEPSPEPSLESSKEMLTLVSLVMNRLRLKRYERDLIEQGYDDFVWMSRLSLNELIDIGKKVNMLPGHLHKWRVGFKGMVNLFSFDFM